MVAAVTGFVRILTSPEAVYDLVQERRPLLWPVVVISVAGIAAGVLMAPAMNDLIREQVLANPDMPPDAAALAQRVGLWTAIVGQPVGALIYALLAAAVLALGVLFTGSSLPYRTALSLVLFAWSPLLLRQLLVAALVGAGVVADLRHAVTSAALLLPPASAGTVAYRILNLVDPLEWWTVALLAGGVRRLGDTTSRTAWLVALVVWILLFAGFKLLARA